MEESKQQKIASEELKEKFETTRNHLQKFMNTVDKFEESVSEWCQFLQQANQELHVCQKNVVSLEELEENYERLQVSRVSSSSFCHLSLSGSFMASKSPKFLDLEPLSSFLHKFCCFIPSINILFS